MLLIPANQSCCDCSCSPDRGIWPGGVTVSTPDSESGSRGSNPRRASAETRFVKGGGGGAIARPRPRRLPLGNGLRACDQIAVYVWICMYAHQNCMVVSVFLCLFCVCVVFVHRRPAKSQAKSPLRVIKSIFLANVMLCSFGAVPVMGGATVPSVLQSPKSVSPEGRGGRWAPPPRFVSLKLLESVIGIS